MYEVVKYLSIATIRNCFWLKEPFYIKFIIRIRLYCYIFNNVEVNYFLYIDIDIFHSTFIIIRTLVNLVAYSLEQTDKPWRILWNARNNACHTYTLHIKNNDYYRYYNNNNKKNNNYFKLFKNKSRIPFVCVIPIQFMFVHSSLEWSWWCNFQRKIKCIKIICKNHENCIVTCCPNLLLLLRLIRKKEILTKFTLLLTRKNRNIIITKKYEKRNNPSCVLTGIKKYDTRASKSLHVSRDCFIMSS